MATSIKKFTNRVKQVFFTFVEDQTELEIQSENAKFSNDMTRNARQQQLLIQMRKDEAERAGNWLLANQLETGLEYQKTQEKQWSKCGESIERWIYSGPVHRVKNKCPEYEDYC